MKTSEKAYMAGIIDGEGSIVVDRRGNTVLPQLWIAQKVSPEGKALMDWMLKTFGGKITIQKNSHKGVYRWFASNHATMLKVLMKCLPFFIVKRWQVRLIISFLLTKKKVGKITGFGYQNSKPPEEYKTYCWIIYDYIQRLNQGDNPPAETECEDLIALGKYMSEKYGKRQSMPQEL